MSLAQQTSTAKLPLHTTLGARLLPCRFLEVAQTSGIPGLTGPFAYSPSKPRCLHLEAS